MRDDVPMSSGKHVKEACFAGRAQPNQEGVAGLRRQNIHCNHIDTFFLRLLRHLFIFDIIHRLYAVVLRSKRI